VLLREPLNPLAPALAQLTTLPFMSVKVMIVLLNVAWMWAMPTGMFFFSFFFAVRLGLAMTYSLETVDVR
jgi:hypothetical protein